jgi:hypothetical protein
MTCRHLHGKLDQDRGRMCVVGLVVSSVFWCSICFKP